MSHKATGWLSDVTDVTPSEFRILFILCDCHNPSKGCFPSQGYLQTQSGMSNGSINNQLNSLEKKGLILRERRIDSKTRQRKSTMYILQFEIRKPSPDIGERSVSNPDPKPSPNNGQSQLQLLETNYVKEPVKEPVNTPLAPKGDLEAEFERFYGFYPRHVGHLKAKTAFMKARKKASLKLIGVGLKNFVDNINGTPMDKIPHAATWLNQERWKDDQTHAANRGRTSEDDMRSLGGTTAGDDMANLFGPETFQIETNQGDMK